MTHANHIPQYTVGFCFDFKQPLISIHFRNFLNQKGKQKNQNNKLFIVIEHSSQASFKFEFQSVVINGNQWLPGRWEIILNINGCFGK